MLKCFNYFFSLVLKMTAAVHISELPFLKMILHAAKHPECSVNGLLLSDQTLDSKIIITDYIPLFHSVLNLTPMLETALYHVDSYCTAKGLRICGYFQANEHVNSSMPTNIALKIGEKLAEKCGAICILGFKNDALYRLNGNYFTALCKSECKWNETKYTFTPNVNKKLEEILHSKVYRQIVDFDDHLNDVNCDFLNLELSKSLCA
ncbi:ER membrane protein complex subunit 9 [Schistosoma japonicum]|nr:ER membrane protein complex subunit 9 [Schistosoma japonicum]